MRILHVLYEIKFSGAEIMYADAAKDFQELGCELYALNTAEDLGEFSSVFEDKGILVGHIPKYSNRFNVFSRLFFLLKVYRFIKKHRIDLVHTHTVTLKWDMAFLSKIIGCRSVYTIHNVFMYSGLKLWYNRYLRFFIRAMGCKMQAISDSVYLNEKTHLKNDCIKINNWYSSDRFFPADLSEKRLLRSKLELNSSSLILISVGGCSQIKRHDEIIRTLPLLIDSYPDLIYLHLGEGKCMEDEIKLAKDLGVFDNIRFLGNKIDVRNYLICADYYIMPSKHEGIPITTIEAMASNVCCILYKVPGLVDFNIELECAHLIDERFDLIAKSVKHLEFNVDERFRLINNADKFVNLRFSLKNNVSKIFFDLYLA